MYGMHQYLCKEPQNLHPLGQLDVQMGLLRRVFKTARGGTDTHTNKPADIATETELS